MKLHKPSGWYVPDFFPSGPGSYIGRSEVIEYALSLVDIQHRTVIQAGAHVGVWPKKLAGMFEKVVCFEPVPSNWECLVKNLQGFDNVELNCSALGSKKGKAKINHRVTSSGGHHMATRVDVPYIHVNQVRIEDVVQGPVDAMFLDIEGYEIEALKGAKRTVSKHRPLLVVENNGCSKKFGYERDSLHQYLEPMGYKQIGAFDEDLVFHAP